MKLLASLSLSGSLVILILLLSRPLVQNRLSKRWQYYIWLAAILRLLLPLSPEASPVGSLFQEAEAPVAAEAIPSPPRSPGGALSPPEAAPAPAAGSGARISRVLFPAWLAGALFLLTRKIVSYRNFLRRIRAGSREISDPALLDQLARAGKAARVRRPVELYENPLAASPMLLGVFRPCIILPSAALSREDFHYTALHELTHCRRRDTAYKWLVQFTVCLHWFNPLVWLMAREIGRACELACDEAVLQILSPGERRAYGGTLLRALESGGSCSASPGATALGENAKLLKERLTAIMNFKKHSKLTALASLVLAAALITGSAAAGAYTGPAKEANPASYIAGTGSDTAAPSDRRDNQRLRAALAVKERYQNGDIAGFSMLFPFLSGEEQTAWLERCYEDQHVSFFNVCLSELEEGDPALAEVYAQRAYEDQRIPFFSVAVQYMDGDALDNWISRVSGERTSFLVVLLDAAGRDGEKDALEEQMSKEYEAKRLENYQAHGITKEGKRCYYQGTPVRVFLDRQPNSAFYSLNIDPSGEVDIQIIRDDHNQVTGAVRMTRAEADALFGDWDEPEEEPNAAS